MCFEGDLLMKTGGFASALKECNPSSPSVWIKKKMLNEHKKQIFSTYHRLCEDSCNERIVGVGHK